MKSSVTVIRW